MNPWHAHVQALIAGITTVGCFGLLYLRGDLPPELTTLWGMVMAYYFRTQAENGKLTAQIPPSQSVSLSAHPQTETPSAGTTPRVGAP